MSEVGDNKYEDLLGPYPVKGLVPEKRPRIQTTRFPNEMTNQQLAELADWADHHAKEVSHLTWKRAYALIREGADLLLRRRALSQDIVKVAPRFKDDGLSEEEEWTSIYERGPGC